MLPYRDSRITRILFIVFFIAVLGYAAFEAQGLLLGPVINISSQTTTVDQPFITIRGHASHIASLKMNGENISVTEDGTFEEPYVLAPGLNHISFDAVDKYGRARHQIIEIAYRPAATSSAATTPAPTATTTVSE